MNNKPFKYKPEILSDVELYLTGELTLPQIKEKHKINGGHWARHLDMFLYLQEKSPCKNIMDSKKSLRISKEKFISMNLIDKSNTLNSERMWRDLIKCNTL